jgi:protein SCO1/2
MAWFRRGTVRPIGCALLAALAVCSCKKASSPPNLTGSSGHREYAVRGVVREVRPAEAQVLIQHEAIPGYMAAMTMAFDLKDTNQLARLRAGDSVSFKLVVTETSGWLEDIQVLASTPVPPPAPQTRLARDVEPLNVGDTLPEYRLTNQFGQAFNTADVRGQALAITFLFTRCPYPTYCPLMSRNFKEAQQKLTGLTTNWHFLTVSFDPAFDTPPVLKGYAESQGYDPRYWTFATGSLLDVTALTEQFGLVFWREPSGVLSHNLRTAVIDASGRVRKIFEGNKWTSDELVKEMLSAK